MRAKFAATFAAMLTLATTGPASASMAFEDNKLNFRNCDGKAVTARWRGHKFSLSEPGKSLGDDHSAMKLLRWDGTCQAIAWDVGRATFLTGSDGPTDAEPMIRYIAPDGAKWIGIRSGDGFFVSRIAKPGEDVTAAVIAETAAWLARTSKEYTPGMELANLLKAMASDHAKKASP